VCLDDRNFQKQRTSTQIKEINAGVLHSVDGEDSVSFLDFLPF